LGSARIAECIYVMDAGQIVESGVHEDLIIRNGKYVEMWAAQAIHY